MPTIRAAILALILVLVPASTPGIISYPPEIITGPGHYPDSAVFTLDSHTYIADGTTYDLSNNLSVVLERGSAFDNRGAWLMAAHPGGGLVRGWYHAEETQGPDSALKSIAYAESIDGGATFSKPDYPDNQIITNPPIPNTDFDDEGDFYVVRNGAYYYLYFLTSRDVRVHLARARVSDGGKPGTWRKWYNGSFSEPGLGGKSDPIAERWELQVTWVTWNTYLEKWMGLHRRADGWGLSVSDDGISWQALADCTIIEAGFQVHGRSEAARPLVDYLSIISLEGSSQEAGREFWVYYMYIGPHEGYDRRYLMRRRVEVGEGEGCELWRAGAWLYLPFVGR